MTRFCLTIGQTYLNLPSQRCKIRFIIKSDTSFPNSVQQVRLHNKPTQLHLNQQIAFTILDVQHQQAVSVYIIGITAQSVVHLGMFVIDLNEDQDDQTTKKVQGCVGQQGSVNYQIVAVKESDRKKKSGKGFSKKKEAQLDYLQNSEHNQSLQSIDNFENHRQDQQYTTIKKQIEQYKQEKESQIQQLKLDNDRFKSDLQKMQSIHEELIQDYRQVKRKMVEYQSLNEKLSELYQQLVTQNIQLRSKLEGNEGGKEEDEASSDSEDVVSIKIETKNRFCQTDSVLIQDEHEDSIQKILKEGFTQTVSQQIEVEEKVNAAQSKEAFVECVECWSQTQIIEEPINKNDLVFQNALYLHRQKTQLTQYLSKIQELRIIQLNLENETVQNKEQNQNQKLRSLDLNHNPVHHKSQSKHHMNGHSPDSQSSGSSNNR